MKSLFRKIIARFGAFIAVMAVCNGVVMAGAWHSSVVTPALNISPPSFAMAKKSPGLALHAKKAVACPAPSAKAAQADVCDPAHPVCGKRDIDRCDAVGLFCGCHGHDDKHPGAAAQGMPHALPSSTERLSIALGRLPRPVARSFPESFLSFDIDRPPASPLV